MPSINVEMIDIPYWQVILFIVGTGVTITLFFMRFLFGWLRSRTEKLEDFIKQDVREVREETRSLRTEINLRLQSLGHRDRELGSEISGLTTMLFDFIKGRDIERRTTERISRDKDKRK